MNLNDGLKNCDSVLHQWDIDMKERRKKELEKCRNIIKA